MIPASIRPDFTDPQDYYTPAQRAAAASAVSTAPAESHEKGIEKFSYFLGGRDKFEALPTLNLSGLGLTSVCTGIDRSGNPIMTLRPVFAPADYPDSIPLNVLYELGDVTRGTNGLPGYEYLIVKYKDFRNHHAAFVLFCNNETGQFGGCKIHKSGVALDLDSALNCIHLEVNGRKLESKDKFRELFTQGSFTGAHWNKADYPNPVTVRLENA